MTGATGFLGSRLLQRLLTDKADDTASDTAGDTGDGSEVTLLVRDDEQRALARLRRTLPTAGGELWDRVRPVRADLTADRLGLTPRDHAALAERCTRIWHCAALIRLDGDPADLERVNTAGTLRVLEFASAAARRPEVCHVSTAYVAGTREGRIMEEAPGEDHGFLNAYEHSKHRTERLVHAWSRENERPVRIFRPSVLVTEVPAPRRTPRHPCGVVGDSLRLLAQEGALPRRVRLRAARDATVNLVPVEYTADVMKTIADTAVPPRSVTTYHLTHPHETPLRAVADALEAVCPDLRIDLVDTPFTATPGEAAVDAVIGSFLRYGGLRRTFDRARVSDTDARVPPPPRLSPAYLTRAFG